MDLEYIHVINGHPAQDLIQKIFRQKDYMMWELREKGFVDSQIDCVLYLTRNDFALLKSNCCCYVSKNIKPTFAGMDIVDTDYKVTKVIVGIKGEIR